MFKRGQTLNRDFVFSDSEGKHLIQVCADLSIAETKERETRALIKASRKLADKSSAVKTKIITLNHEGQEDISGLKITYVPAWKWCLES